MARKGLSIFSKAPELEPHHEMVLSHNRTPVAGRVLPLWRDAISIFYNPRWLGYHWFVSHMWLSVFPVTCFMVIHDSLTAFKITDKIEYTLNSERIKTTPFMVMKRIKYSERHQKIPKVVFLFWLIKIFDFHLEYNPYNITLFMSCEFDFSELK